MNEQVQQVIDAVRSAAPVIWQAAYRQTFIEGLEDALLVFIFIYTSYRLAKHAKAIVAKDKYEDWGEPGPVACIIFSAISGLLSLPFLICGMDYFLNPTFSAIKMIIGLAKHQ